MKNYATPVKSMIRYVVPPLLLCSASFILCMHWFLLMADSLVVGITTDVIPVSVLESIIAYYTVIFGPMTWLIKVFILLMLLSMTLQLTIKEISWHFRYLIFITNAPLVFMGVFYIIPLADRFILNTASAEIQSQSARTIHSAHVASLYGTVLMIVLQLIVIVNLQRQAEKK